MSLDAVIIGPSASHEDLNLGLRTFHTRPVGIFSPLAFAQRGRFPNVDISSIDLREQADHRFDAEPADVGMSASHLWKGSSYGGTLKVPL